jgi:hypothetical protein
MATNPLRCDAVLRSHVATIRVDAAMQCCPASTLSAGFSNAHENGLSPGSMTDPAAYLLLRLLTSATSLRSASGFRLSRYTAKLRALAVVS